MSPLRQTRQLSTVLDTESYTEDLFPESEKDRTSWYSAAQNSSMTSGLDSAYAMGTSYKSITLRAPVPRNPPKTKAVAIPSSLPSRMANLSSFFGKKSGSVAASWNDMWDEDEEDTLQMEIRKKNNRTWSQESKHEESTVRRACVSELNLGTTMASDLPRNSHSNRRSPDGASDHGMFVFEEQAPRTSSSSRKIPELPTPLSPPRRTDSSSTTRTVMDKWMKLGNSRRQYSQTNEKKAETGAAGDTKGGKWMNTRDWRAGFGFKFYGNGGGMGRFTWEKDNSNQRKETANAKVRNWRQSTTLDSPRRERLPAAADVEWVGGSRQEQC